MKIVFLDSQTMGDVPNFSDFHKFGQFISYPLTSPQKRIEHIHDSNIVITCKVVIDKEIIDACPSIKLICVAATGTNNVDVNYAISKGIQVKNVVGYSTESVAQHTIGLILSLVNRVSYYNKFVTSGEYSRSDMFTHYGSSFFELKGKTLGIIGLGNIGSRVAEILKVFGMNIVYYSTSGKNSNTQHPRIELNKLLSISDIISIHCPLNNRTKNLISRQNIECFKPSAILINVARGGIVNEMDIVNAINNKLIAGYATDVFESEPISKDSSYKKLINYDNVIFTPHIAWTSLEARSNLIEKLIENIDYYIFENQ